MNLARVGIATLLVGLLGVASCSNQPGGGTTSGTTDPATKSYSVGLVSFSAADPTSQLAITGFTDNAPKNWSVTTVDPQGAADKAVAAIQNLVQKKVDLIVVAVFPSTSLAAGLLAAKAAKIPVVSLSGGLADGVEVDFGSGTAPGQALAKQLVTDTGGQGDLLALGYSGGLPCIEREKALDAALAGTGMHTTRDEVPVPGQVQASTQFTQAWLAQHPGNASGLAVWGCFDDPALGAVAALKQAGRSGVKVYGINGTPSALRAVQSADMAATVYLRVYDAGKQVAQNVPKYVSAGVTATPNESTIPFDLVTKDNITQFLKANPSALSG